MASRVEDHTASVAARGLTLTAIAKCVVITCDHVGCSTEHAHAGTDEERAAEFAAALARSIDPEASAVAREHAAVTVRELLALLRGAEVGRAHGTQAMRAFPHCTEAA